jgi:hypothetical protein
MLDLFWIYSSTKQPVIMAGELFFIRYDYITKIKRGPFLLFDARCPSDNRKFIFS